MLKIEPTSFRDSWLQEFYVNGTTCRQIPNNLERALRRKLDILNNACDIRDLMSPPSNQFEYLNGKLKDRASIRVNEKYRLEFEVNPNTGEIADLTFHKHVYRAKK